MGTENYGLIGLHLHLDGSLPLESEWEKVIATVHLTKIRS